MNNKRSFFWGLFFLLAALVIIIHQFGYLQNFSLFSLAIFILMIPAIINGITRRNYFSLFFALAIEIVIIFNTFGVFHISLWTLFLVAIFLSLACTFLFPKYKVSPFSNKIYNEEDSSTVQMGATFCESVKYINSDDFKSGRFSCKFGSLKLYFDNCKITKEANLILDVSFGNIELFIPRSWKVINNVNCFLGVVDEKNLAKADEEKTIIINGSVSFGEISITYI